MSIAGAGIADAATDHDALQSALTKNVARIIPFLALAYVVNFLDRTSVGFAALQMNRAIGLTPEQFGYGAGIVFVGYCLFEVPSNLFMYRFGARVWIARIMITWGLAASATALAWGPLSFYVLRFLLGVFEAGFFPGVIWYLSIWFPANQRASVMALFTAAAPFSQLIGGPISVALLGLDGWLGLGGWQWMFLLEGLPAVVLGIAALHILADEPRVAAWLNSAERDALLAALAREPREHPSENLLSAMKDPRVLISAAIVFCYTVGSYGLGLWLPLILDAHQLSTTAIGWLSVIPFLFATLATLALARFVDRTGLKFYTLLLTLILGLAGMVAAVYANDLTPALICISLGLVGTIAARTVFYTIPQHFLAGAAAAGGLAFINSIGSFGGFVGPSIMGWFRSRTGSYDAGMIAMAAFLVIAIGAAIALKRMVRSI